MTIFQRIEALEAAKTVDEAAIAALQATPPSGVTTAEFGALSATVAQQGTLIDGLRADVGTPATPPTP